MRWLHQSDFGPGQAIRDRGAMRPEIFVLKLYLEKMSVIKMQAIMMAAERDSQHRDVDITLGGLNQHTGPPARRRCGSPGGGAARTAA